MKRVPKFIKSIFLICIALFLFRSTLSNALVKYQEVGERSEVEIVNKTLIQKIESRSKYHIIDFAKVISIANEITTQELSFTFGEVSNNPNEIIDSNRANCIGYSSMFNSIANYLIKNNSLESKIQAKHKIGQLLLLGIDIHQFFSNPFFKDHDFNEIVDLETGKSVFVDPTVSDYLRIKKVSKYNPN